ncbi:MAG TPA: erythromycin esterase family protein [Longimicrobiaceae bacterium]|nr:erythromycin esterase family protein [Longimicrobiaceae bacterium]
MRETGTGVGEVLRGAAVPLTGHLGDYDELLELVGDARVVLLGEATHGTHEFYHERARITRRLVAEKGFTVVAVEADWPDAYRVNRFVRGTGDDSSANEALGGFRRFPTWMWRNTDVLTLVDWLREYNASLPAGAQRVGFYGLDLYSLFSSIEAVIGYLERVDPEAAGRARRRYACFEHFGEDSQAYGYAAELGITPGCEDEAVQQLVELQRRAGELARADGRIPEDEHFFAEQNARLVRNAEEYYRSMFRRRVSSWNLRDRHMAETLEALVRHFDARGGPTKVVVWEHNSHIGDARATEMGEEGELNVGQLARERWGRDAVLVGFTTHHGTVTAASDWDQPGERKRVRPALAGSYEALFHLLEIPAFLLPVRGRAEVAEALGEMRLERAIGVVYLPGSERVSHYFHARLAEQFDAVVHVDETRAVEPLEPTEEWHAGEPPETFPSGL